MPNSDNILAPTLILGAGRTASSYVISHLSHSVGQFQEIIENDVYKVLFECCARSWWTKDWKWMASDETEVRRRVNDAIRGVLLTLFPSDKPRWAMKMIWQGHEPQIVDSLFPRAKYLHLVRDPRANIPSIVERIGWTRQEAESRYVASNKTALSFQCFGDRYLRVQQEEFDSDREDTWRKVCVFLGASFRENANWAAEVNVAKSQAGKGVHTRAESRMEWRDLPPDVREMAESLGYLKG